MASQAFPRLWADANRLAHSQLIGVLNGDGALVTAAGALAASPRRRRTLLQMTIGGTLTVLAVMTAVSWGQASLVDHAVPGYQAMTSVIVHALTTGFVTMTTWCVAGGLAITAIALLPGLTAGPSGGRWSGGGATVTWAARLRQHGGLAVPPVRCHRCGG